MSTRMYVRTARTVFHRSPAPVFTRNKATIASSQTSDVIDEGKPYSEIPGPKGLPVFGTTFETIKRMGNFNELIKERHDKYGPIYKEKLGLNNMVFLRDVKAVEQLLRQDGKYPRRLQIELWQQYRKKQGLNTGLLMSDGEKWHDLRRVVDKYMMKIKTVESYTPEFNKVVEEFLQRVSKIRTSDNELPQLDTELFNWSLESISRILYEKRLGCLSDNRSKDTSDFIQSSHDIFNYAKKLVFLPPTVSRIFMPGTYRKHNAAWDTAFRVAHKTIDERIKEIQSMTNHDEHVGFITHFLNEDTMTTKDVYANISELMGAAVDTTSNTTMMVLYELSRHPEVQDALYEEVTRIVPPGQQPGPEHLREMHYIRAIIKETLRLYPIGSAVIRKLQQDMTLLGYNVPKDTTIWVDSYNMGRQEEYFTDADSFLPERWLRESRTEKPHPFAWLPFGFGPRMCVGRRVAELEIYLLITQLVRKYRIEPVSMEPVVMVTDLLFHPKDPVRIRLHDRK